MESEDRSLPLRQLFGGAVIMGIPARLVDVSDFRPVPDNQEVLADGSTDQSVIVEIMVSDILPCLLCRYADSNIL